MLWRPMSGHVRPLFHEALRCAAARRRRVGRCSSRSDFGARSDRKVKFPLPDLEARMSILRIHSRKMSLQHVIGLRGLWRRWGSGYPLRTSNRTDKAKTEFLLQGPGAARRLCVLS
ncbi:hypothetical protein C8J57DRAFT_1472070 [Mycena rebaudengoi]|nr:hypothetical protein C8J57DRAFT_1472070 [Mycena rebaudengoi]